MNTSGEVADLMVKEGLMITEEVVKLTGLGAKNLAAIVIALLKEDNKLQGKTNLKKLLKSDKPLCILQIKESDIGKFNSEAKKYGVLFTAVNDKSNDTGLCDIIAKQDDVTKLNYIMEKLAKGNTATNINYVSLVAEYNAMTGKILTKQQFLNNQDGCLRMVNRIFKKYKALLTDMTTLFTLDSTTTGKFIPDDRFTFSVIGDFNALLESELYSTTYHDEFVKAKGFREVPSWQGLRGANTTLSFDDLTTINAGREDSVIGESGVDVNQTGVIGLMCDKWAIMHTVVRHRMGVQRDDIKDITLYEHQFTDRYINNLMLNGVVFTV
jgi:hypothetical protein